MQRNRAELRSRNTSFRNEYFSSGRRFQPIFSTSAYDSSIVGMTQIGMLSTDSKGNITYGDNEPTVTKDYIVKETEEGGKKYTTYEFLIKTVSNSPTDTTLRSKTFCSTSTFISIRPTRVPQPFIQRISSDLKLSSTTIRNKRFHGIRRAIRF